MGITSHKNEVVKLFYLTMLKSLKYFNSQIKQEKYFKMLQALKVINLAKKKNKSPLGIPLCFYCRSITKFTVI